MNALQKVAWTELIVSGVAFAVVLALYPWLGERAISAFALLGFLAIGLLFKVRRGDRIVSDERDRRIELLAKSWGFGTGWTLMVLSLIAIAMWHGYHKQAIPVKPIIALIWIQFAVCYAVKGVASLYFYRGGGRASQI